MHRRTIAKNIFTGVSALLPFSLLRDKNLILPYYHTVSDRELPHIRHLYKIKTSKEFIKDIDFLLKEYNPVSLYDLLDHVKKEKPLKKNSFFLSFDDGLSEIQHIIAPILKQKGIPATFFLNSAFIDNKDMFYRYKESLLVEHISLPENRHLAPDLKKIFTENNITGTGIQEKILNIGYNRKELLNKLAYLLGYSFEAYLEKNKPYLSTDQINDLLKDGFTIGAHSIDHPLYSNLSLDSQLHQTKESINFIQKKFNLKYKIFAFPFLDKGVTNDFFKRINKEVDITFGTSGMKREKHKHHFQRIEMEGTGYSARAILHSAYLKKCVQTLLGLNTIKRDDDKGN